MICVIMMMITISSSSNVIVLLLSWLVLQTLVKLASVFNWCLIKDKVILVLF